MYFHKESIGKVGKAVHWNISYGEEKKTNKKRTFEDLKNIISIVAPGRTLE